MNRKYLPVMLDITKSKILILGGGKAAAEKLRTLEQIRPSVKAIALEFMPVFEELDWISKEKRAYRAGDLKGFDIVYCGINNREEEEKVRAEARSIEGLLINFIDNPESSDFISASVLARSAFSIFISSYGQSPGAVKYIREQIEKNLDLEELNLQANIMASERRRKKQELQS